MNLYDVQLERKFISNELKTKFRIDKANMNVLEKAQTFTLESRFYEHMLGIRNPDKSQRKGLKTQHGLGRKRLN